jgi:hypothetical protein
LAKNLPTDKALYGEGEEDSEAEEDAGEVHEAVLPTVVLQEITCSIIITTLIILWRRSPKTTY